MNVGIDISVSFHLIPSIKSKSSLNMRRYWCKAKGTKGINIMGGINFRMSANVLDILSLHSYICDSFDFVLI